MYRIFFFEEIKETLKESCFFRICDTIISYLLLLLLWIKKKRRSIPKDIKSIMYKQNQTVITSE